jgi:SAM-dependent methyltransferase
MDKCIVCGSQKNIPVIKISEMPIFCNVLLSSKTEAINALKGDLDTCFCENCGHIYNKAFNPGILKYTEDYENTLHYSRKFQTFAEELAYMLISKYAINRKNIIDIGCGKGDFLNLICTLGNNNGVGFDPNYQKERSKNTTNVRFVKEVFSIKYADLPADLVCCRHVLEHIENPVAFLSEIVDLVREHNPVFYFEVPNALYTVKDLGIWDLIYEHVSYFTKDSLESLFKSCRLEVLNINEGFGGQYLMIEGKIGKSRITIDTESINTTKKFVDKFYDEYNKKKNHWERFVNNNKEKKIVMWGAGSKGVAFLNVINSKEIEYIVDINSHKQGRFVPGIGTQVVSPEFLEDYRPDIVILMNALYEREVKEKLDSLGLISEIFCG